MIAWLANTLDEISGGRFVLGLGAGWHQPSSTPSASTSGTASATWPTRSR